MKNIIRWILVLPAAVCAYIGSILFQYILLNWISNGTHEFGTQWWIFIFNALPWLLSVIFKSLGVILAIWAGAATAPRRKPIVAIVVAVLFWIYLAGIDIFGLILSINKQPQWMYLIEITTVSLAAFFTAKDLWKRYEFEDTYPHKTLAKPKNKWIKKAEYHIHKDEYEIAVDYYNRALQENPNNNDILYEKAKALDELKKFQESLDCYNLILINNPNDEDVLYRKAYILLREIYSNDMTTNKYNDAKALSCFERVVEINPINWRAWGYKGEILENQADNLAIENQSEDLESEEQYNRLINGAKECYSKAIELGRNTYERAYFLYKKGVLLSSDDKEEDAISLFDIALNIEPSYHDALSRKAFSLRKLKRYSEAIKCYDQIITISKENIRRGYGVVYEFYYRDALKDKGQCLIDQGFSEEGNKLINDAKLLD
jgi:tetratricopeptide (TPR) repeat protein